MQIIDKTTGNETYLDSINTPAILYKESEILSVMDVIYEIISKNPITFLYSIKACSDENILRIINNYVDGFSCSSAFEAMFVSELFPSQKLIHYVSPLIKDGEINKILSACSSITFNSLTQWNRYRDMTVQSNVSPGLRVNPNIKFVKNDRYNPSGKYSKLGISTSTLAELIKHDISQFSGLEGIHFHTNCESTDFTQLLRTVQHLDSAISPLLREVTWINLGGGYYFDKENDYSPLFCAIELLKNKYDLEVIIEPGAALIQNAGRIVSEVIDIFEADGKTIAILDTSINHLPEVFEFGYQPEIEGSFENGGYEYILAGASCLAGDKFGIYRFESHLNIGDRVVIINTGAYSIVKMHMFNGIDLPDIYCVRQNGDIDLLRQHGYIDFLHRNGAMISESIRKRA